MREEDLSPAAQAELYELIPAIKPGDNWNLAYLEMLKELAQRKIHALSKVEVTGQGAEALDKSHEEHAVAVELRAYAIAELGADKSAEVAKYPSKISMPDFHAVLMPKRSPIERKKRFNAFLVSWAEARVDEEMELLSTKLSRTKFLKRMVKHRLLSFGDELLAVLQRDLTVEFRAWSKIQNYERTIKGRNVKRAATNQKKLESMLELLPLTTRANEGITRKQWESRALKERIVGSKPTFTRWKSQLEGRYLKSKTGGKYYRNQSTPEMNEDFS